MLIKRGLLSEGQLEAALDIQRRSKRRLGEILVREEMITRTTLMKYLTKQWLTGAASIFIGFCLSMSPGLESKAHARSYTPM